MIEKAKIWVGYQVQETDAFLARSSYLARRAGLRKALMVGGIAAIVAIPFALVGIGAYRGSQKLKQQLRAA